jgi:hypothetical protein
LLEANLGIGGRKASNISTGVCHVTRLNQWIGAAQ